MQPNVEQYRYFWAFQYLQKPLDDVEASFGLVHDPLDHVSLLGGCHGCHRMQELDEAGRVLDA